MEKLEEHGEIPSPICPRVRVGFMRKIA